MQLGSLAPSYQAKKPSCGRMGEASAADVPATATPPIVPPPPPKGDEDSDVTSKLKKYLPYIVVAVALYYIISKNK
jgi:hypothetical protein